MSSRTENIKKKTHVEGVARDENSVKLPVDPCGLALDRTLDLGSLQTT